MAACLNGPFDLTGNSRTSPEEMMRSWTQVAGYFAVTTLFTGGLIGLMLLLFRNRWTLSWREA
jgi:hypothetical protein